MAGRDKKYPYKLLEISQPSDLLIRGKQNSSFCKLFHSKHSSRETPTVRTCALALLNMKIEKFEVSQGPILTSILNCSYSSFFCTGS